MVTSSAFVDDIDLELTEFSRDPLGFVLVTFEEKPRSFQRTILADIRDHLQNPATRYTPYRCVIASGHGVGKTALMGQLTVWALSTCEDARVEGTAGTGQQLSTKTVPEIQAWVRKAENADWFEIHSESIRVKDSPASWRADFLTWDEANPQAFAGLHNAGRRILVLFDEASTIPQAVWEAKYGTFTDERTEIIMLAFSQEERSSSYFSTLFDNPNWKSYRIDAREVEGTSKSLFEEWSKEYGEDSDFFRVRVRGLPPRTSETQFIDRSRIEASQKRRPVVLPGEPLIAGVDLAWGGDDNNVVRFRRGLDAFSFPSIKIPGEKTREPWVMVNLLSEVLSGSRTGGLRPKMMFIDSAGICGPVAARLREMGYENVREVNYGAFSPDIKYENMRAYMWGQCKEWLNQGGIDDDRKLASDLAAPGYKINNNIKILIERKEDVKKRLKLMTGEGRSPDDADALCLTFAAKVSTIQPLASKPLLQKRSSAWS